jgi:hypothetical protein
MLPGMPWSYYVHSLPLAVGMQLRNAYIYREGGEIVPPGRGASAKLKEILGDHAEEWV